MSQIATGHHLSASAATYQVTFLVNAGLVHRRKRGAVVLVGRSDRGVGLIRLYDSRAHTAPERVARPPADRAPSR